VAGGRQLAGINSNICIWLCKKCFSCTVLDSLKCLAGLIVGYPNPHKLNVSRVSHVVLPTDITFHTCRACLNLDGGRDAFMSRANVGFYVRTDRSTGSQWNSGIRFHSEPWLHFHVSLAMRSYRLISHDNMSVHVY
jgi:hypothetical protein